MKIHFINALLLGLASSIHCLGMCGPIAMSIPVKSHSVKKIAFAMLQYIVGKASTYAVLGLIVGCIGISVHLLQWMNILSVLSGLLIIIFAWHSLIRWKIGSHIQQKFFRVSSILMGKLLRSEIPLKSFFFGSINGLLPCGLVYIALINSLLSPSISDAAITMALFGLGTAPILIAAKFVGSNLKLKSNKATPILITVVGLMIILRGLNLGIPYISPKMEIIEKTNQQKEIVMSCCSKSSVCTK